MEFPDIIWNSGFSSSLTRYIMAMLSPVAYLVYLLHRFPKRYSPYLRSLCYLFSANFFISVTLQLTDKVDFAESVWITHICFFIMVITLSAIIIHRFYKEKPVSLDFKLECVGMILLTCAIAVEVYLYYRLEYMMSGSFLRFGLFVYISCLAAALIMDSRNRREEAIRVGQELQNSRLRLMISQIQPHFIYNTLSSVRTLIKIDPDKAYDLVYDFSKYLRANIDSIGQDGMIPFSRELEHIKNYCGIEKLRFGDKLSLVYHIEADDFLVPPLTVQPLVENAIKHGIRGKSGIGTVKVHSFEEDTCYVIEVLDNGAGFDTSAEAPRNSAGLKNIQFRLEKIADARLEISSIPEKGTRAVVILPKKKAAE
ncbi:histidine kinase [Clostridium sp. AM58-1XD]|uniref:sensor histidine kinase n=1 Tax=Clostridium sp. AM58-1XD TaxID=2292307 RepID=UPI0015F6E3F1|nr:histidine kinase [Clostridium sp. AM58-1XD]